MVPLVELLHGDQIQNKGIDRHAFPTGSASIDICYISESSRVHSDPLGSKPLAPAIHLLPSLAEATSLTLTRPSAFNASSTECPFDAVATFSSYLDSTIGSSFVSSATTAYVIIYFFYSRAFNASRSFSLTSSGSYSCSMSSSSSPSSSSSTSSTSSRSASSISLSPAP